MEGSRQPQAQNHYYPYERAFLPAKPMTRAPQVQPQVIIQQRAPGRLWEQLQQQETARSGGGIWVKPWTGTTHLSVSEMVAARERSRNKIETPELIARRRLAELREFASRIPEGRVCGEGRRVRVFPPQV